MAWLRIIPYDTSKGISQFYFSEHVNSEYDITLGQPIRSISDLLFDHSSCNYFATLCGQTDDPMPCEQMGQGVDGCSFSSQRGVYAVDSIDTRNAA